MVTPTSDNFSARIKYYYLILLGLIMVIIVLFAPRGLAGIVEDVKMKIRR